MNVMLNTNPIDAFAIASGHQIDSKTPLVIGWVDQKTLFSAFVNDEMADKFCQFLIEQNLTYSKKERLVMVEISTLSEVILIENELRRLIKEKEELKLKVKFKKVA
jgi:hypothetical protein